MKKKCVQQGRSCSGSLGANLSIPCLTTASHSLAMGPPGLACAACTVPTSCRGPAPGQGRLSLSVSCGPRAAPAREATALPVRSYLRRFMNDCKPPQPASEWEGGRWPEQVCGCVHTRVSECECECVRVYGWGAATPTQCQSQPSSCASVPGVKQMELDGQRDAWPLHCPTAASWQGVLAGTGSWQVISWQGDGASALSHRPCPRSVVWEKGRRLPPLCSSSTRQ